MFGYLSRFDKRAILRAFSFSRTLKPGADDNEHERTASEISTIVAIVAFISLQEARR